MAGFKAPDVKTTAADSLFGSGDLFAPAKDSTKLADDLFASLAPKEVKLSAASQQAINNVGNAYQNAISSANAVTTNAQNLLKQQQSQIQALNQQADAYAKQATAVNEAKAKQLAAVEKERAAYAKKQAAAQKKQIDATVKALEDDPTKVVGVDLDVIFDSDAYKEMGTIQRREWANVQVTELKSQVDKNLASMAGLDELPKEPWSIEQQIADPDGWKKVEKLVTASATIEKTLRAQVTARVNKEEKDINKGSKWIQDLTTSFKVAKQNNKIAPLADVAYKADTTLQNFAAGKPVSLWELEDVVVVPKAIRDKVSYAKRTPANMRSEVREPLIDPKNLTAAEIASLTTGAKTQLDTVVPKIQNVRAKATQLRTGFSDEQTNDMRNMSYENALWEAANPEAGWARKSGKGVTMGFSYLNSNLVNSLPATAVAAASATVAGAATGAVLGAAGGPAGSGGGAVAGAATALTRLIAISASAAAVNPYIVSDYADSAFGTFDNIPTEKLASAVQGWDGYLAIANGDPEVARKLFIASAVGKGVSQAKLMAAVSTLADPGAIAGTLTGTAIGRAATGAIAGQSARNIAGAVVGQTTVSSAARGLGIAGLSVLGEAVEEGTTQYLANTPAFQAGILDDRWDGVAFAAGVGAALGGAMGGTIGAASALGGAPGRVSQLRANQRQQNVPGYSPAQIQQISQFKTDILGITQSLYTTPGAADTNTISSAFITALSAVEGDRPRQALYDSVVEDPVFKLMTTPEQRQEISLLLNDRMGISSNQFTLAGATVAQRAYDGDVTTLATVDPVTQAAINVRDGDAITNGVSERVAQAANTLIAALDSDPNSLETTFERQADALVALGAARAAFNLSTEEFNELQNFAYNELNAKPERMTDAEVIQFNQTQAIRANQQAAGTNNQNVPGATGNATTQSTGNNNASQATTGGNQAGTATGTGQSNVGNSGVPAQTGATGAIQNFTPAPQGLGGTPLQPWTNGQAGQGQSTGLSGPVAAQTPTGGGSTGATPAGSNTNTQRADPASQGQPANSVVQQIADFISGIVSSGLYANMRKIAVDGNGEAAGVFFVENLATFLGNIYTPQATPTEDYTFLMRATEVFANALADGDTDFLASMIIAMSAFRAATATPTATPTPAAQEPINVPSPDRIVSPGGGLLGTAPVTAQEYAASLESRAAQLPDSELQNMADRSNRGGAKGRATDESATVSNQTETMRYGLPPSSEAVADATLGVVQNEQAQGKRELRASNAKPKPTRKKRGSLKARGKPEVQSEQAAGNTARATENQDAVTTQQEAQAEQGRLDFAAEPVVEAQAEPVAEAQAEPVAEAQAEPVAEAQAEPVVEAETLAQGEMPFDAPTFTNTEITAATATLPESDQRSITTFATGGGKNAEIRARLGITDPTTAVRIATETALADAAVGGLNQPAWQGVSKAFKSAISKLLKALQNGVKSIALVSMTTLALLNADITTTPAMAAPQVVEMQTVIPSVSPDANAVRNYVAKNNDNKGKPYIVADKKAGTLYLFDANGNKLNETPAVFGRDVSDTARSGSTPAGKFELNYMPYDVAGYGGTVQAFVQQSSATNPSKGEIFAVHRVIDVPGQNRLGRLASKKSSDNRISDGCINVPDAFYNNILDGKFSGPMYVIPETTSYTGNRFGTQALDNSVIETTPAQPTATILPTAQVDAEAKFDDTATMRADQPISQPIIIEGTEASSQVAMIEPIVTENGTATSAYVPEGVLTPAEQTIEPVFDTQQMDVESEGMSLYDVVGGLLATIMGGAGIAAGVVGVKGLRRTSLRNNSNNQNPQGFVGPPQPFVGPPAPSAAPINPASVASSPAQAQAIAQAQAQQAVQSQQTRLEWYDYFNNVENDPVPMETLTNLYWRVENAFTDNSLFDGVNTDNTTRPWKLDKFGLMEKMLSGSGGATVSLDEWARKVNLPKYGVEMDSSSLSTKLARIKGMQSGALAILSKMGLKKVEGTMQDISDKTNYGLEKTETDIGDYANLRHYNESGIDHFLNGFAYEVEQLAIMKGSVEADIASKTTAGASTTAEEAILKQVSKDLRKAQTAHIQNITYVEGYDAARDFVNNAQAELAAATGAQDIKVAQEKVNMAANMLTSIQELENTQDTWLGTVRLPGGRTREQTQTRMEEIEGEYEMADLTQASDAIYAAVRSNVGYATANGVFTVEDLARFQEVGLTNYVPAWAPKKDKAVLGDESAVEDFVNVTPLDALLIEPTYFKGLGMAPDITRFSRKGSLEAPADAMTNLRVQTTNLATRVAERQFTLEVEQLFEGSHFTEDASGQRIPVTGFVARQDLVRNLPQDRLDMLANNESFTPGIGRVKKGDPIPGGKSARMKAKGFDSTGEYRDYVYYFTEDKVQMDVERSLKNSAKPSNRFTKGVRRTTGMYAGLMTHLNVLWNIIAGTRTVGENAGNLFLRDLRDRDGNKIPELTLQRTFAKNNALFAGDMVGIAQALMNGDENTQAQRLLAEARRQGTLHIYSDVVNQKRERDMDAANKQGPVAKAKRLGSRAVRSNPVTRGAADVTSKVWDAYSSGYVETVQIIPILATLQTALDLGVNPAEAHRVTRDMFDPQRNSQEWGPLTTVYAFANSTKSGMYTTTKNLTQYGAKGPAMVAIVASLTALMAAAVGQIEGDDEDGIPKNASDNISNSQRGIGVPMFGGKGFIPVGHGLNTVAATLGGIMYKSMHGKIAPGEAGKALVGSLMDNLTPFQVANSKVMEDSVWAWFGLTIAPTLAQGVAETAVDTVAFTGAKIKGFPTPMGQNDADRDSFYTPEVYKDAAKFSKYSLGIDVAPEMLEHILKRYAIGPAEIFPYMAEDIGTKTAGTMSTNSDELGVWGIITGVTSFDPKFYDIRRRSYDISNKAIKRQQKYRGISSTAVDVVTQQLAEQGAPESDIEFITNNITYQKQQKKLMKAFKSAVEVADSIEDKDSLEYTKAEADIQIRYAEMEQNMQAFTEMNNEY